MINQSGYLPRLLGVGLFFFCLVSCSTIHKVQNKKVAKENTVDKSITTGSTYTQSITTEKADTLLKLKADTARIQVFLPVSLQEDTTSTDQEIETDHVKISIHAKPVFINGKKTGTNITATAIKKADSVSVIIDKKTITNSYEQTQNKKDITQTKNEKEVATQTDKKRFNIAGLLCTLGIVLLILILIYHYLKKQYS